MNSRIKNTYHSKRKSSLMSLGYFAGFRHSFCLALLSGVPGLVATVLFTYINDFDLLETVTILAAVFIPWLLILVGYYNSTLRPWQSVANILMSFREQDFSLRASVNQSNDVVNIVLRELNEISTYLSDNRNDLLDVKKLLTRVLAEVDVGVMLFDNHHKLEMVNRYGASLYNVNPEQLTGQSIDDLELGFAKLAAFTSSHEHKFPARKSRWLIKHSYYRQQGLPYEILLVADIGKDLRQEELEAWRKLIRILSHEINNALTPLKTTVGTMTRVLHKGDMYEGWQKDFTEGLNIIDQRIDHLNRMVSSYANMARLPEPKKSLSNLSILVNGVLESFTNHDFVLELDTELEVNADHQQLEQVLVNVIKNAVEASDCEQPILIKVYATNKHAKNIQAVIEIHDSGKGVENIDNLFIPYFTTKPDGSGIGLIVSRQIIEAHGGRLELHNHQEQSGCCATISLPC